MSRQRTRFPAALAALLAAAPLAAQGPARDFEPDYTFQGSQLAGWRTLGAADWRAQNGELVGTARGAGGGWLLLDRPYQDVALATRFRCPAACDAGLLLRAEPTPQGMRGLFLALNEAQLGTYRVTLDAAGRILTRERVRPADVLARRAPAPQPAGAGGGTPTPPAPRGPVLRPGDWNEVQALVDADIVRGTLNGTPRLGSGFLGAGATDDEGAGVGPVALYVGAGEVRFAGFALANLRDRVLEPERVSPRFRMQRIDEFAYAWDAAVADFNRDGVQDVVAGPFYYLGPDYTRRREIYLGRTYSPGTEFVPNMVTHAGDFTGDGWPDVLATESRDMVLYLNPGSDAARWTRHPVLPGVVTELTLPTDLDRDGIPEIVYGNRDGTMAFAEVDRANPTAPWPVHRISAAIAGTANVHGLGVGDVDGDGRLDILHANGWWSQPAAGPSSGLWTYHPHPFATAGSITGGGGGNMAVFDVNGDGLNDVVTSLNAHGWGLAWHEQRRDAGGAITFTPRLIMGDFSTRNPGGLTISQLHSGVIPADVDGDGVTDLVTGKRHYSHLESYVDPDPHGPAYLVWYRTVRNPNAPGGVEFVPDVIHNRSGVGSLFKVADVNADGAVDVVTSTVWGSYLFWGTPGAAR